MLRIHNSLTGKIEELRPLEPGKIKLYVCGITVYDYCHIGHMRMMVVFDLVRRYLRYKGLDVTYVRNITDIDDKIIARAAQNNESIESLTTRFTEAMHEDAARLGIEPPTHEPRATQYVPAMQKMIATLIARGHAYVSDSGDVLYSVSSFPNYGALSGKRLEDLRAGARVEVEESKRDPADFVLWKLAKPGEPSWDSPWGAGRPGWHIECSAMATALFGTRFDIHGGGMDLKFPHHENEIAQSCGASGDEFARLWMHNGFVHVDNQKMSKSLGNFFTLREVLPKLRHPEVMRYFLLASQYRGPINYSLHHLEQADAALTRLYTALRGLPPAPGGARTSHSVRFEAALDDDFNSPEALAVLQSMAREINSARGAGRIEEASTLAAEFRQLATLLGIVQVESEQWFRNAAQHASSDGSLSDAQIDQLIAARLAARAARNFTESDRIRDELGKGGVLLDDQPDGRSIWRRR
ncbi:MAG: cysteine--tRNA ligase [Steroidobacteraceae bacterium]